MTQINGISQTMVDEDGEPLEIVLSDFAAFIQDLPLVSFNAEFDMAFLQSSAARHNIAIRNRASCALKMARRAWPERSSYRLCDLAKDAGLSDEDAHRALGDCKRTVLVYTAAASILGTAQ
jgi:DNA polymerase III alpha subunit (gram-positive type)